MALNPKFIVAPSLQSYFVDKNTGEPLAGGKVFTYSDVDRTTPKPVYTIAGNASNYTYVELPNPIILSGVGTVQDDNFNDDLIYWYPYDADGDPELYYVVVQDSLGNPQFTREAWPNPTSNPSELVVDELINYIPNGQMLIHNNVSGTLVAGSTSIAYGGITIELPTPVVSTNTISFAAQQTNDVTPQSPRYLPTFTCSSASALDDYKIIRIKFDDVNKFSTVSDFPYTFAFWAESTVSTNIDVAVYKYFGTAGSAATTEVQATVVATTTPTLFNVVIDFGDNTGKTIDTTLNDDFVAIDLMLPTSIPFSLQFTDFVLLAGNIVIPSFPVQTDADMMTRAVNGWTAIPNPNGSDIGRSQILTSSGMVWGSSSKYAMTVFTSSGTFTTPSDSSTSTVYHYRVVGAGGGGGGTNNSATAGGGGGAGAYAEGTFTGVAASTAIAITVSSSGGAGGANTGATGATGGSSVIAAPVSITCTGGVGGTGGTGGDGLPGGAGGTISVGSPQIPVPGVTGVPGFYTGAGSRLIGGQGGASPLGAGGAGGNGQNGSPTAGSNGSGFGAGGGGAANVTATGGNGSPGIVIIERVTL